MQFTIYHTGSDGYAAAAIVTADTTQQALDNFKETHPGSRVDRVETGNPFDPYSPRW